MMEPSHEPLNVSVEGFFNQKITFKSGEAKISSFKVYNAVQAFFKNAVNMVDYKTADGKVYHLDRQELESFLDARIANNEDLVTQVLEHIKKDPVVIRNIRDLRRIVFEKDRKFKTLSEREIRLYDNFTTYDNKGRVNVHQAKKCYLYTGKSLTYSISLNWGIFWNQYKDQTILVNEEDLNSWFYHEIFSVLERDVGKETIMEWARESNRFNYYSLYDLSKTLFQDAFEENVITLDTISKNVDSILKFKEAKDLKQEEARQKKEQEAAQDLEKVNKANAEYLQVLQKISGPQVTPQALPEVQNYRSYDLRNGKQDYELSQEEAKAKREREEANLKYNQVKADVGETKVEDSIKDSPPKRHEEGSISLNDKSGPLDSNKSKGPKRH